MEKIRRKRLSRYSAVSSSEGETGLPSPQEVIDSLGPDAFGDEDELEEGPKELHQKLTEFVEKSPDFSPELVSEEAPEAFFLSVEAQLGDVEKNMVQDNSKATYDEKVVFSKQLDIFHYICAEQEIPAFSTPEMEEAAQEQEKQRKIAEVIKRFSSPHLNNMNDTKGG